MGAAPLPREDRQPLEPTRFRDRRRAGDIIPITTARQAPAAAPPSAGAEHHTRVMHVDIDAFFAQVEQVRNPELRGRPVAVGSGVVASASYEARRRGVEKGMPLTRARRLVPELVLLEGSYPVYRAFAERVFEVARDFAPILETYLDEAYFDLTGTETLHGDFRVMAMRLKDRVREATGLGVTVGIAANRMLAKIAGGERKPDGFAIVPRGEEEAFLARRPASAVLGVGRERAEALARMNVRTVTELRKLSPMDLAALFGQAAGLLIYERARGRDPGPLEGRDIPRTISRETSFHQDTIDRREVEGMLHYLTERAMRTARQLDLAARTVEVRIGFTSGGQAARSRSLRVPTSADSAGYALALLLLSEIWPKRDRLHRVGVTLSNFHARDGEQSDLFQPRRRDDPTYYRGLDEVRDRFGHASVVAGRSLALLGRLEQDRHGYVLRTPSLTK